MGGGFLFILFILLFMNGHDWQICLRLNGAMATKNIMLTLKSML